MKRTLRLSAALVLAGAAGLAATTAYAHGFGERYDLPLPLNYFMIGAAATVALSFVVIGLFVRQPSGGLTYPRYDLLRVGWLRPILTSGALLNACRALSVFVLGLVIVTGLLGTSRPVDNFAPVFVWIIWWVGMGYISALVGHVWMAFNPWKALFEWGERLVYGRHGRHTPLFRYPRGWDAWPALLLFLAFAWLENVYDGAADPRRLAGIGAVYSLVTLAGMVAFGKHQWLQHGEAFSVLFGFFARFSPTEVRVVPRGAGRHSRPCDTCDLGCDGPGKECVDCYACFERASSDQRQLALRPYAVGLALPQKVSQATAAFVLLALATVTFDGLTDTPAWGEVHSSVGPAFSFLGARSGAATDTLGLVLLPALFVAVYVAFSWAMKRFSGEEVPLSELARAFVFSLVPIALAYNLAHYISFIAIQGQLIVPLASDPFGFGWDIFGAADYAINVGVLNAKAVWFISIAAIVLGHILAVYVAHVIALRTMADHARALRSQYPMLVLMVFYTATSLWIIAQPIVNEA